ncbi:phage tail family protein [Streptomyces sp. NRRL S-920]|uniref:phage tail family protein n=1 Tax=Streptomyces sp. NRRL S-920 TaxID=1463921 RepID=UPI0004C637E2|nr:phage tail family protein [Streptomyces sp. NRRL S-920]
MADLDDWTCEFAGLVMGRPDTAISLVGVDGLLSLPDIRTADLTLVQRHGLYPGDDYMNGRAVTLTLEVYGRTREEFTAALSEVYAAFRPAERERPFRFRFPGVAGDRTGFVNVRPRKRSAPLDLNFMHRVCNIVVELFATDPHIYGDALRTYPLSSPWQGSDPRLRFTHVGSVPALPVIRLENAANCVLMDEVTGQYFGLTYGGNVTIDATAQTVLSDAGNDFKDRITQGSVWPEYNFGEHRLKLTSEAQSRATTATITWRDRWV